ncbi:MAG TPA: transcription antitermination factor NusB [Porticoccaceae bacterium]|nr:transcription antitermination factor NusB [Porticoccaceae bacterium]
MSKLRERQKARRMLVQALYSWDMGGASPSQVSAQFTADNDMSKIDSDFFCRVLFGVASELVAVDGAIEPHLNRTHEQLDPISRAVLRLAAYEMLFCVDVPYRVVINEGINLAKTFGPEDAFKFINGVLDCVAAEQRTVEVAGRQRSV